jgi:ribosomal protein L11 methyltransferase
MCLVVLIQAAPVWGAMLDMVVVQAFWRSALPSSERFTSAVDIDPAAVTATQANAEANHVVLNAGCPIRQAGGTTRSWQTSLATPLQVLALLCAHVMAGGHQRWRVLRPVRPTVEKLPTRHIASCTSVMREEGWILMTAAF